VHTQGLVEKLAERIRRGGPITFAEFQDAALYDPEAGFFTTGGGAGRVAGDFVTSPEVGALFGTLVARYLDDAWHRLGEPDPFVVVEAGAGRGRLASDVLRTGPACAPALRYVLVERSAMLRSEQRELLTIEPADEALGPVVLSTDPDDDEPQRSRGRRPGWRSGATQEADELAPGTGPIVASIDELPGIAFDGVVVANELLDNLPVRIVERTGDGWAEVRVGLDGDRLVAMLVPADATLAAEADVVAGGAKVTPGVRLPVPTVLADWLAAVAGVLRRGEVLLVDYAENGAGLAARGQGRWLRTYRHHERGGDPLDAPGSQDITCDVSLEYLRSIATRAGFVVADESTQAAWLTDLGVEALVEEGRAVWRERAHLGDLAAISGRSRVGEAAALLDPDGLGSHRVVTLERTVR
jgi:SAM-dependent MidA family methyltransferase